MRKRYFRTSSGHINAKEFITRVNTVLRQHSGVEIEHMEVKHTLYNEHANHVDRWIDFAIASKTKELIIDLSGGLKLLLSRNMSRGIYRGRGELYNIPPQLFSADNGPYLQRLQLTSVSVHLPANFEGFLNLKKLTLVDVSIADEDVQRMLSRCNLLEFFEIAYCRMVTSLRMPKPLNQLNHLLVDNCPLLQVIELNCCPTILEYTGTVVPLIFTSTRRLKILLIKFVNGHHAGLDYMVNGFPSALPSLEALTLHCAQHERINLPVKAFIFTHLRHLRLELVLYGNEKRETDVLDYAYLLEIAPFMEKLELLMWLCCQGRPYCKEDGELRSRPPHHHTHLKSVRISGFFGHKDQVELALHILRSSIMLEKMEINPKVEIADCSESDKQCYERKQYVDGHRVATEFVCKADHRNVVDAVRASFSWGCPLDYGHARGVKGLSRPRGRLSRRHKGCRGRHP
ncbi:hypothetical protein C2845_PM02G04850 [Panicum miliaceum]|uniref:At1g61320/AtMIF1 LRR domain-containing protein n=1 Tax=Panicum miliaceum TaxID=4540 RepID=A0A3L6S9U5_PANMI|nr:hypothetical protein C2845_PM02G04850 [Panicum miliaceum]